MLLRVRVNLPDRPGSLGKVAVAMGYAGADISEVVVLERANSRAVNDFIVSWPSRSPVSSLCDELTGLEGTRVVGVWHVDEAPGAYSDVAVLARVTTSGESALVESVPAIFSADWAVIVRSGVVTAASRRAPDAFEPPVLGDPGPHGFTASTGTRFAAVPLPSLTLLAARTEAPPFHPSEITRLYNLTLACASLQTPALAR